MADTSYLDWPFLEPRHKELASSLERWAHENIHDAPHARGQETDAACVALVRTLGAANWIRYAVGGTAYGGSAETIDTRAICLLRETLARHSGLADFAFAMQGLGSGAITLDGSDE